MNKRVHSKCSVKHAVIIDGVKIMHVDESFLLFQRFAGTNIPAATMQKNKLMETCNLTWSTLARATLASQLTASAKS